MKGKICSTVAVAGLILLAFIIGWYSGGNYARVEWQAKYVEIRAELEGERTRNELIADLLQ